jgi:hypothetical protein
MTLKNIQNNNERTKSITFLLLVATILLASGSTSVFAQTVGSNQNVETANASTDKNIYNYGDTIHLSISDTVTAPADILTFKNNYPGIVGPCGINYMDFAFLKGDYTNVKTFDDLVAIKSNVINVVYASPYDMVNCMKGYTDHLNHVSIGSDGSSTMTVTTNHGKTVDLQGKWSLFMILANNTVKH